METLVEYKQHLPYRRVLWINWGSGLRVNSGPDEGGKEHRLPIDRGKHESEGGGVAWPYRECGDPSYESHCSCLPGRNRSYVSPLEEAALSAEHSWFPVCSPVNTMAHNFLPPFSGLGLWFEPVPPQSLCVHCAWVLLCLEDTTSLESSTTSNSYSLSASSSEQIPKPPWEGLDYYY